MTGIQNCLFPALGALSLLFLSLILIKVSLEDSLPADAKVRRDYSLRLLVVSAWAGMSLADNLLMLMAAWFLFLYVINQWLTTRNLRWRIFVLRDDYGDDGGGARL